MINDKELLRYLTEDNLTISKIANLKGISRQALYKRLRKLKKKGLIVGSSYKGFTNCMHSAWGGLHYKKIRVHAGEFRIILSQDSGHKKRVIHFLNNRIHIYKRSIRIWGKVDFIGDSVEEAINKAQEFYNNFFTRLQYKIDIFFYKEGYLRITQTKDFHIENSGCLFAKAAFKKDFNKITVKDPKDNKIRFQFDKSLGLKNTEAIHPEHSVEDAEVIFDDVFNSLVDGSAFTPRQATQAIGKLAHSSKAYIENIEKHLDVLDDMKKTMHNINKALVAIVDIQKNNKVYK